MAKTVEGWVCGVAADHELGWTNVTVYATKEDCELGESCATSDPARCAPVRLTITIHERGE